MLDPDAFIITVGALEGLNLAIDDLVARGVRTLATEAATYSGVLEAARGRHIGIVGLAVDEEGLLPDQLDRTLGEGQAQAVYVTPVAQNPLGCEMSETRVRAIVAVAAKHRAPIVEDDIYYGYRRGNAPTLKEISPRQVYFMTSLSKCATPLPRVGILAPPQDRLDAAIARHHASVWSVPPLTAAIAANLVTEGCDRTAAEMLRAKAQARRQLAVEILPAGNVVTSSASHVWLPMDNAAAERFARHALERGVRVTSPSAPIANASLASGIRLCLGAPESREVLAAALRALAGLFSLRKPLVM